MCPSSSRLEIRGTLGPHCPVGDHVRKTHLHRETCWIILKEPERGKPFFAIVTLRWTKKAAIEAFMDIGNGQKMDLTWRAARRLYRFRAVRVSVSEVSRVLLRAKR